MTTTLLPQTLPPDPALDDEDDPTHLICCRFDVALCGLPIDPDDVYDYGIDDDDGVDCAVCMLMYRRSPNYCPLLNTCKGRL